MLSLNVNWPRVASICILVALAISSFYLRLPQYSFVTANNHKIIEQNHSPVLLLSQVKMIRFEADGSKHSTLIADKVTQFNQKEGFFFSKPQLQLFSKQAWYVQSNSATADAKQKEFIFSETVTAKHEKTIIETPSLIVSQTDQKAYSNQGAVISRPLMKTSAGSMTIFFEQPKILLNKQVKTRYVPASK